MMILLGRVIYGLMSLIGVVLIFIGVSEANIIIASPELIGGVFLYGIGRDIWKNVSSE
jgi:hypothetical protein